MKYVGVLDSVRECYNLFFAIPNDYNVFSGLHFMLARLIGLARSLIP